MLSFKKFLGEKYIALKHSDLTKRGGARTQVFVQKVQDGEPFMTTKGAIIIDKSQLPDIQKGMYARGYRDNLKAKTASDNKPISVSYSREFLKTPEFGGKGAGFGTAAEDAHLAAFVKELEAVFVTENQPIINLVINGRTVECAGIISTPQRGRRPPKSDFSIVNSKKEEVAFLSHKAGKKPSDFQQYGGLSADIFKDNPEIISFMKDLKSKFPNGLDRGQGAFRLVNDQSVVNRSVYGVDYGGAPGHENVDEFHQGFMKLKKLAGNATYEITSGHKGKNGSDIEGAGYEAIYYARYTGDRGATVAGEFINNARIGVFPRANAPRTATEI